MNPPLAELLNTSSREELMVLKEMVEKDIFTKDQLFTLICHDDFDVMEDVKETFDALLEKRLAELG